VQALAPLALQSDVCIPKYIIDKGVHGRFLEFAPFARRTAESSWPLDILCQELADICIL
jgi:hypothetical protein